MIYEKPISEVNDTFDFNPDSWEGPPDFVDSMVDG